MRKRVVGRNLAFSEQQALAARYGVGISALQPRILFNFLEHSRSAQYPDGPDIFARTSTLTPGLERNDLMSGCGNGDFGGLNVYNSYAHAVDFRNATYGAAVELR